jgi:hypothetical protein
LKKKTKSSGIVNKKENFGGARSSADGGDVIGKASRRAEKATGMRSAPGATGFITAARPRNTYTYN